MGPFSITAEREAVIDYTHPFMEDGAGILMRRPSPRADDMLRIFLPFHRAVWGAICSAVVLVGESGQRRVQARERRAKCSACFGSQLS